MAFSQYLNFNVCSENKYTKRSSNTLLCLVYLFSERTLENQINQIIQPT